MDDRSPAGATSGPIFGAMLLGVFSVTSSSSVLVPLLPFVFERLGTGSPSAAAWHVGMLSGVYLLVSFVLAPIWGRWSDKIGRRRVLIIALAGQTSASVLIGLQLDVLGMYLVRALGGAFAAATLPVVQAWVADQTHGEQRARRFAWVAAVSLFGFLVGPLLGGLVGSGPAALESAIFSPLLALPALAAASISAVGLVAVYVTMSDGSASNTSGMHQGAGGSGERRTARGYLIVAFVLLFGIGAFEVAVSLLAKTSLAFGPKEIGLMFVECSLVMIVAQAFAFSTLAKRLSRRILAFGGLLAMAAAIMGMPFAQDAVTLAVLIAIFAGASGLLIPLVSFWVSSGSHGSQGALMGKLSAVSNLGQAAGAMAAGPLFALQAWLGFALPALLLGIIAVFTASSSSLTPSPAQRKEAA